MSLNPKIVIVIIGAIALALTFRQDFISNKKITFYKIFLVMLFLSIVYYGVVDVLESSKSSKKDNKGVTDSVGNEGKKTRKKVDTVGELVLKTATKTDRKLDTGFDKISKNKTNKPIYSAILGLSPTETKNPEAIKTQKQDSFKIRTYFTNYGKGTAFNIKGRGFYISIYKGKIIMQKDPVAKMGNKSMMWYSGINLSYGTTGNLIFDKTMDSTFLCLKIDFSDSTNIKKSFPIILWFDPVDLDFKTIQDDEYNRIENFIIKNKYWKPPFRQ